MKFRIIFLLVFGVFVLSITSCNIQSPIIGGPTNYEVEKFDLKEIHLKIWLPIENPNSIGFKIKNVDFDIFVNGMKLGKVTKIEKVKIPANSKEEYAIKLHVEMKDLGMSAMAAMGQLGSRKVLVKLDGTVTVSKFVVIKKVEVQAEESIKIW